jgi:hypothetical protein
MAEWSSALQSRFLAVQALSFPDLLAGATHPRAVWPDLRVLHREEMSTHAFGFTGVLAARRLPSKSAPDVFLLRNRLKMAWVYATPHAAKMVDLQSGRDAASLPLEDDAVGKLAMVFRVKNYSIASVQQRPTPKPATGVGFGKNPRSTVVAKSRCRLPGPIGAPG